MPTGEPAGSIPNVGLFPNAIKGKGAFRKRGSSRSVVNEQLLLEQLLCGRAMGGNRRHMLLHAGNFRL